MVKKSTTIITISYNNRARSNVENDFVCTTLYYVPNGFLRRLIGRKRDLKQMIYAVLIVVYDNMVTVVCTRSLCW